jgi:hypothetical protein
MPFGKRQPVGHYGVEPRGAERGRGDLRLSDYQPLPCTVAG